MITAIHLIMVHIDVILQSAMITPCACGQLPTPESCVQNEVVPKVQKAMQRMRKRREGASGDHTCAELGTVSSCLSG